MAVEPREIQEQRVRHRHTHKSSPTPPPLRRQVGMSKTLGILSNFKILSLRFLTIVLANSDTAA